MTMRWMERLELLVYQFHGWAMCNLLDDPALLALIFC